MSQTLTTNASTPAPLRPTQPMTALARQIVRKAPGTDHNLALQRAGGCKTVLTNAGYQPTASNCANLLQLMNLQN